MEGEAKKKKIIIDTDPGIGNKTLKSQIKNPSPLYCFVSQSHTSLHQIHNDLIHAPWKTLKQEQSLLNNYLNQYIYVSEILLFLEI